MTSVDANSPVAAIERALGRIDNSFAVVLALSGGRDSVVLAHLLAERCPDGCLRAVHVNHGLAAQAGEWEEFCRQLCRQLDIPFLAVPLDPESMRRGNLEASARRLRYRALLKNTPRPGALLTAHHLDDQAETYLLRQCRGVGVYGAGAMRPDSPTAVSGVRLLRPLLSVPAADLDGYARAHRLDWIEDPLNDDQRFERNWVRHSLLPLMRDRHDGILASLGANARLLGQARRLCVDLARIDHSRLHDNTDSRSSGLYSLHPRRAEPATAEQGAGQPMTPIGSGEGGEGAALGAETDSGASEEAVAARRRSGADTAADSPELDSGGGGGNGGRGGGCGIGPDGIAGQGTRGEEGDSADAPGSAGRASGAGGIDGAAHSDVAEAGDFTDFSPAWPRWRRQALAGLAQYRLSNLLYCYLYARNRCPPHAGVIGGLMQWLRVDSGEYSLYRAGRLNFRRWRDWVCVDDWRDAELAFEEIGMCQWQAGCVRAPHPSTLPSSAIEILGRRAGAVCLRSRRDGDSLLIRGHRRKLNALLNERGIEPWLRGRIAVLCIDAQPQAIALPWQWLLGDDLG